MSQCNLCLLQAIKRDHPNERIVITIADLQPLGGYDVLIGPKTITRTQIKKERKKYFAAWFWDIPKSCDCDYP